jgi:hypothetical protein
MPLDWMNPVLMLAFVCVWILSGRIVVHGDSATRGRS